MTNLVALMTQSFCEWQFARQYSAVQTHTSENRFLIVLVFGIAKVSNDFIYSKIPAENETFGDIVLLSYEEAYRNVPVSYKVINGLLLDWLFFIYCLCQWFKFKQIFVQQHQHTLCSSGHICAQQRHRNVVTTV